MDKAKLPFVYVVLTVLTGLLSKVEGLAFLSLGISLFVPALYYAVLEKHGCLFSFLLTVFTLGLLFPFAGLRTTVDVASLPVLGYLLFLFKSRKPHEILLLLSSVLFAFALLEELFFGIPRVSGLNWFYGVRWGFYLASSLFFSYLTLLFTSFVLRRDFGTEKVDFGFYPVFLFLIGGFGSLILKGVLKTAALNVLSVSFGFLLVQGLSVGLFLLKKASFLWRILLLLGFLILPLGVFLVAVVLGLLDLWFDFRKLKGGKRDGSDFA